MKHIQTHLRRINYEVDWFDGNVSDRGVGQFCDVEYDGRLVTAVSDPIVFDTTDDYTEQVSKARALLDLPGKQANKYTPHLDGVYQRLVACRVEYQKSESFAISKAEAA